MLPPVARTRWSKVYSLQLLSVLWTASEILLACGICLTFARIRRRSSSGRQEVPVGYGCMVLMRRLSLPSGFRTSSTAIRHHAVRVAVGLGEFSTQKASYHGLVEMSIPDGGTITKRDLTRSQGVRSCNSIRSKRKLIKFTTISRKKETHAFCVIFLARSLMPLAHDDGLGVATSTQL